MNARSCTISRLWFSWQPLLFLAFAAPLVGCGPSLSSVSGTVTFNGEKVKGGTLIFSPVAEGAKNEAPGPPASATVKDDGTFVLHTDGSTGAVIGKSTVSYTAPGGEASKDPSKQGTPSPYSGLVPKDTAVEVKSGTNTFNIELVKKGK